MKKILILCLVALIGASCLHDDQPDKKGTHKVATALAAQDALDGGKADVTITEPLSDDAHFSIPPTTTGPIKLSLNAAGNALHIEQSVDTEGSSLMLNADNVSDLNLDTPAMSVTLDGNVDGVLTATVADNTLVISEGATVNELRVLKGFVHMYGVATTVSEIADGAGVLYPVATAAEFRARISTMPYDQNTNSGVVFTADISDVVAADGALGGMTGKQENQDLFHVGSVSGAGGSWDGYVIHGDGHTLSGAAYNNILAIYADNVTVRDITVLQTEEQKNNLIEKSGATEPADNDGIDTYEVTGIKLIEVTTKNCGHYGVVVNGSSLTATDFASSGNGWGGVNIADGSGVVEAPSFTFVSGDVRDESAFVLEGSNASVDLRSGNWSLIYDQDGMKVYSATPAEE